MTSPVIGHPDFQSYAQWRAPVFESASIPVTSVSAFNTTQQVTNFASVYMKASLVTGTGFQISVKFYDQLVGGTLIETYTWQVNGTAILSVLIPCLTNVMVVTISTAQAGTQTAQLFLAPNDIPVELPRYQCVNNVRLGEAVSIPATSTTSVQLPKIAEGRGYVNIECLTNAIAYHVRITAIREDGGVLGVVFEEAVTTSPLTGFFEAHGECLLVNISNDNAAAQNFNYAVGVTDR